MTISLDSVGWTYLRFVRGERVEFSDVYYSGIGTVLYHGDTDKVGIELDCGNRVYVDSENVKSWEIK